MIFVYKCLVLEIYFGEYGSILEYITNYNNN
jgi:hypothetical protein